MENKLKKIIRIILKIPATPFVLIYMIWIMIMLSVMLFFEWVYLKDTKESKKMIRSNFNFLLKWFGLHD